MDLATAIGLILGFVIVSVVMIMDGGSPAELFAHPSAILLTMGGALAVCMTSFPLKITLSLPKLLMIAFLGGKSDAVGSIELIVNMADKARREGLLALEEESRQVDDAFLRKGVMLVVDGTDPDQVRSILKIEIESMEGRHHQGIEFFNKAGAYAPTLGIIGTVMGLITVLQQLDDPASLGAAIAGAFLATLWGIMSANLLWLPLGSKLGTKNDEEVVYRHLLVEGLLSLQAGENPRLIREKLMAFLPPKARVEDSEAAAGAQAAEAGA